MRETSLRDRRQVQEAVAELPANGYSDERMPIADTDGEIPSHIDGFANSEVEPAGERFQPRESMYEPAQETAAAPPSQPNTAELEKFLINFVVEHTGYPAEAVDLDSDLEGDLGIDSIKKAQLFAELAEYFDARPAEGMTLDDFPTLRHALNFLVAGEVKKKQPSSRDEPAAVSEFDGGSGLDASDVSSDRSAAVATLPAPPIVRSRAVPTPEPIVLEESVALADLEPAADDQTLRYVMRMRPAPLPKATPLMPQFNGATLIVGANAAAEALAKRLHAAGATVHRMQWWNSLDAAVAEVDRLWARGPIAHLILMTDRDPQPFDLTPEAWRERRHTTAEAPLFICQRWIQLAGEASLLPQCSLVAATALGGDFGFGGKLRSPTGGALAGLAKGVYIEIAYLRNFRSMLAKAIDFPDDEPPESVAACICRELAGKSVDFEIAYVGGKRFLPCAYPEPTPEPCATAIRPGGSWVFTGGATGITAQCALELGRRFKLKLHLIGRSPQPEIPDDWRDLAVDGLKALRTNVMREARGAGCDMNEAWSRVERDLEIDRWLRQFTKAGIDATYHSCDVADDAALADVLARIRRQSGPIEGIVHGAGIERACRFERKQRDSVAATIASKVDGAVNLMRLTWDDPVRHFVGFGSISGRMGSNGQVDYCLASELLCKLAAWYGAARPEARAIGFHWHSWGEIGMAAKPEATKAIKNFDGPDLMPKQEGVRHFLRELLGDSRAREALITAPEFCRRYYRPEELPPDDEEDAASEAWPPWPIEPVAARHRLATSPAPLPASMPLLPSFDGPVWIMGDSPLADALSKRLREMHALVEIVPIGESAENAIASIDEMFRSGPPRYLFLLSGRDEAEQAGSPSYSSIDADGWRRRRERDVMAPLLAVQHLMRLRRRQPDRAPITIVAVTAMGGDFGLSGQLSMPESGILTGMLKSLYIEDSRLETSEGRFKAIDAPFDEPPEVVVDAIMREMAVGDPHIEVGWSRGRRTLVRAIAEPAEALPRKAARPSGTWVVTGGARGITAAAARELATRYGVKLHLIGRSAAPPADAPWLGASPERLTEIRARIVRDALAAGRPIENDWERVRTDIEIDATLKQFSVEGIQVTYHTCDLSDWSRLAELLDEIRRSDGPIEGVLHGAGYGKSGRFDTRPLESIERTLAGKLDGALALMALTRRDPLKYWIGFGSLSGRFGGNGLADYAAANDMLAKLVGWHRAARPECAACCFHWQSWNEIGMAMLGDSAAGTKNILKMNFLAPQEGLEHFCREIEAGLPQSEILITDGFFERTFYPFSAPDARRIRDNSDAPTSSVGNHKNSATTATRPMVASHRAADTGAGLIAELDFDPASDPFLLDHTLRDRPFLPAVAALEAIAETATLAAGKPIGAIRDVQFVNGMRFNKRNIWARVSATPQGNRSFDCRLTSDVAGRSNVGEKLDRLHVRCVADVSATDWPALAIPQPPEAVEWRPFRYPSDSPLLHGPTLHSLLAIYFDPERRCGWGKASALSLASLGGEKRGADWLVPATLIDAGFYACGVYVWFCVEQAVSLPAGIGALRVGRMPRDNEPCRIELAFRGLDAGIATFDFIIHGEDGAAIAQVESYRCQLLGARG
jgi:NAD(P)-dependent dehydrogenase (short-subunit alcohol dehydrogenase family)/acyl carrier protein